MRTYGYTDPELTPPRPWRARNWIALALALLMLVGLWLALDQKLLFGDAWMSPTYDNPDWRTNEGNLHTFGAWDLEAHVWKTEYIMEHFPDFHWNPYWYLGMPLVKYYQSGFYLVNILFVLVTGLSAPRAALLLIIFSHLLATLLTFLLCYKVSRKIWVSALCASFLLANTFISLRSYGWEPITVVFLFLYPLGLMLFLKDPLRPFRFWLVLVTGIAFLCHPLLWLSLLMTMGLYIFSILARFHGPTSEPLWQYFALVICSILLGAVQFIPQITYTQATSGAHMGVSYLPFYQVPYNIITLKDFLFDAGNLKGPGPIIMIAIFLLVTFTLLEYKHRKNPLGRMLRHHEMVGALAFVLFMMVLFYYLESYNIFPMNLLRSTQYHRIIPEFIITAAALIAALSNIAYTYRHKFIYYTMLITFVLASTIVIYNIQAHWLTTDDISGAPEFLEGPIPGRISFPYTDQSLSVRNSFTEIPQTYGYYEQGIRNTYNDEVFSVSSGYHNADLTLLYLKAANVGRLYVNTEEGDRDRIIMTRLNRTLTFYPGERYSYFIIPLKNPSFSQAVDGTRARDVQLLEPPCRTIFKEEYCGSRGEEFVSTDEAEQQYLRAYVALLEEKYAAASTFSMHDPDHYTITVQNATADTSVVVKMTYDPDFRATIDGEDVPITPFGPYFMLLEPGRAGEYTIALEYHVSKTILVGGIISVVTLIGLIALFIVKRPRSRPGFLQFKKGDM